MKTLTVLLLIFFSTLAEAKFYISELFANRLKSKEPRSQWIELHNLSEQKLQIEHVLIEVFNNKEMLKSRAEITLVDPILFEDRLVLAQDNNLGLGHCLQNSLNIIVLASFNFEANKAQKICVTLNNSIKDCATLSIQDKFADRASLYRNIESPLWRQEPCELLSNIFATPGTGELACLYNNNFAQDILCTKEYNKHFEVHNEVIKTELWRIDHCEAPLDSELICNRLDSSISHKASPRKIYTKRRDLYGLEDRALLNSNIKPASPDNIRIKDRKNTDGTYTIIINIPPEVVPVNYWLKNSWGVQFSGAFLEAGRRELHIGGKDEDLSIFFQNELGQSETRIIRQHFGSSCTTTGIDFECLYILVIINIIITRIRRGHSPAASGRRLE